MHVIGVGSETPITHQKKVDDVSRVLAQRIQKRLNNGKLKIGSHFSIYEGVTGLSNQEITLVRNKLSQISFTVEVNHHSVTANVITTEKQTEMSIFSLQTPTH
jgi:acetyltransferase-like isoleucine patch superfamily enzyme